MSLQGCERLPECRLDGLLGDLLTSGGDTRLAIDPQTLLNDYGCSPYPRPRAFTFSSSTATSISDGAYLKADLERRAWLESVGRVPLERSADLRSEMLRSELLGLFDLHTQRPEIIFSPSGTDSQLHALFIARALAGGAVVSIVAGADETGSGTAHAALGRHFNNRSANGVRVAKGEPIPELADGNSLVEIRLRTPEGELRPAAELDRQVIESVARVSASGRRALLHVMDCSKLGAQCPSAQVIEDLRAEHGARVQIVVDACQGRLGRTRLRWYLDRGCMVLLTGSKFFTGPPFCGILLVPADTAAVMAGVQRVPPGFCAYANRCDWPVHWRGVRRALPDRVNVGQVLRWTAALEEIRRYFQVPAGLRAQSLQKFALALHSLLAEHGGLETLHSHGRRDAGIDDEEMRSPTIFPFLLRTGSGPLSVPAARKIYQALNTDVRHLLPVDATADELEVAACLCHIGQPVALRTTAGGQVGAIRISVGARYVYGGWSAERGASEAFYDAQIAQVRIILRKIALLQKYFAALAREG